MMRLRPLSMKKITAALLTAVLMTQATLPVSALADEGAVYYIGSAGELYDFAMKARVQTYSTGKTFILSADIDMSEYPDFSIPYLDGSFEGRGHTISGIVTDDEISDYGLFRYIGRSGAVYDLTVEGAVICGDDTQHTGLIAGTNGGSIVRCTAMGSIDARSQVGGIAGFNEMTGSIRSCTNRAGVEGKYQSGGIAGLNEGEISLCRNEGGINLSPRIKKSSKNSDGDAVNISVPNAVTGFAADERANETGGIAGSSKGRIVYCSNSASVGYKELGSDTGGIVGRSSGSLVGCENDASVNGRMNVGGIAGFLDPYKVVALDRDYYDEIRDEFDEVDDALEELTDAGRRLGDDLDENFGSISDRVKNLKNTVRSYLDDYDSDFRNTRWRVGERLDDVEDVIDDMDYNFRLRKMRTYMRNLREDIARMNDVIARLTELVPTMDDESAKQVLEVIAKYEAVIGRLEAVYSAVEQLVEKVKAGAGAVLPAISTPEAAEDGAFTEGADDVYAEDAEGVEDASDEENEYFSSRFEEGDAPDDIEENEAVSDAESEEGDVQADAGSSDDEGSDDSDGSDEAESSDKADDSDGAGGDDDIRPVAMADMLPSVSSVSIPNTVSGSIVPELEKTYGEYKKAGELVRELSSLYKDAMEQADGIAGCIDRWPRLAKDIRNDMEDIFDDAKEVHSITDGLIDRLIGRTDAMKTDIRGQGDELSDTVDDMTDTLNEDWNSVSDCFDRLKSSFEAVKNTLTEGRDELKSVIDDKSVYLDISKEVDTAEGEGKLLYCTNRGEVLANSKAGGIVGCVDIDDVKDRAVDIFERYRYPGDEDDDEDEDEDKDSIVRHVRTVIYDCVNSGDVTANSGYAGGVAGDAEYGVITGCNSYCDVSAGDGNWAGGIAGMSKLAIYNCYMFGGVKANAYVGGIAGRGEDIALTCSCAYMDIDTEVVKAIGAIAGKARGGVTGNVFVDNGYGAVDGITKADEAMGVTYRELIRDYEVPDNFKKFTVRFMDGDTVVWSGSFDYADELLEDEYPRLSGNEGEYAYWEKKEISPVVRNATVHSVRRVFVPSIASETGESSEKPLLVLEGEFFPEDTVRVREITGGSLDAINAAKQRVIPGTRYVITKAYRYDMQRDENPSNEFRIRALNALVPANMAFVLDKDMEPVGEAFDTGAIGSYADFVSALPEGGYIVLMRFVSKSVLAVVILVLLIALVIVVSVAIYLRRKRLSRRSRQKREREKEAEAPVSDEELAAEALAAGGEETKEMEETQEGILRS